MMRRFFRSRGFRKFVRSKLAMLSLGVIAIYAATAIAIMFGAITLDDTNERVLPNQVPGFLEDRTLEKRLEDAMFIIEQWATFAVDMADQRDQDAIEILSERRLGERVVAEDLTSDDLYELVDEAWIVFEDNLEEIEELNDHPEAEVYVEQLEAIALQIFPIPEGWDGSVYRFKTLFGSDRQGRSISMRAVYSVKVAFQIGLVTSLVAVLFGSLLGAAAAFFGGIVDHIVAWIYTVLSSIPYLVLLTLLVAMFFNTRFDDPQQPFLALVPVYAAFCVTFWIGPCRVIRGETMKIKELEYVQAATAIGFSRFYILLKHVIPNTAHLMFINFSLLFIGAIKAEVILSFLGLGVKGQPSWGIMIRDSALDVPTGFFWQLGAATALMFVLVLAFNIVSDALQDAFDPKHVD
ncbi:MAG: ABC transporter permease subunit [Phycisphaerales bacterium]